MRMSFVLLLAFAACAAQGAAIMECDGLVTGDTEGLRFEASDAMCGTRSTLASTTTAGRRHTPTKSL